MNAEAADPHPSDQGTVRELADGYQLRFERFVRHPIEKVWAALTDPAQLALWLAPGEIEPQPGGRVHLAFTHSDTIIDGEVTASEPPHLLEFTWTDKGGDFGVVRWELAAEEGGTRLVLTHTVPESARTFELSALAGWQTLLEQLAALLDGQPFTWSRDRWQVHYHQYVRTHGRS